MNDKVKDTPVAKRGKSAPASSRTLGPATDLERHLPSDWWRKIFNSLYLKTDGDVVENEENTRADVDMVARISELGLDDHVLDLCCGQGRHCLELARRGFRHVAGLDRSRYLIRLARKRAKESGLAVEFREGDARKFRFKDRQFQCVTILGNSFGYFDRVEDDAAILANVARALAPNGLLIMDLVDGEWMREHFEPRSWEWIDPSHFVCRERSLDATGERIVSREVVVDADQGVVVDQFYAERIYRKDQLSDLLEKAGFQLLRFHAGVQTDSTRGQDLGMLTRRLIVSALAPQKATPKPGATKDKPLFPRVTVLLGDPSMPDQIKLGGKFNPEDVDVVDRMKHELASLTDYQFTYLDNHQTMIKSLTANPPEFVLNLCDEGYFNDPTLELHLPAVLELLRVPYSGAGPACLGLCYNKSLVRAIAESLDVPTPKESYLGADDVSATIPAVFPALLKPASGDASIGITQHAVVQDNDELLSYIGWLRKTYGPIPVLIQEYLGGPEYSVAVVGNPGLTIRALPVLEVDYSRLEPGLPRILGYESKWDPDSPYWSQINYKEATLDDDSQRRLIDGALTLFERLGCRDYARFDFRADEAGAIKLLEANPNPGWCWDGKLNLMAGFGGLRHADLFRLIIEAAQERAAQGRKSSE